MNHTLRLPASLALIFLFALGLSSCGPDNATEVTATASAAPLNEVDVMINEYEKVANDKQLRVTHDVEEKNVSDLQTQLCFFLFRHGVSLHALGTSISLSFFRHERGHDFPVCGNSTGHSS